MPFQRKLTPLPLNHVELMDGFHRPRQDVNRTETLPHLYRLFEEGGRFSLYGEHPDKNVDYKIYWESEIAKFIEAACFSLSCVYDEDLDGLLDGVISELTSIQQPDGYLNAYITFRMPDRRWKNLFVCHELFNAGTLAEAAVAHCNATGKRTLLDPICRYIDYICTVFGPEAEKLKGYCGHPGIEMALVTLYDLTGEQRYLKLSRFFVEQRGQQPNWFEREDNSHAEMYWVEMLRKYYRRHNRDFYEYNQSHKPAREQREAVGHAVRAMFYYSAMADIAARFHDASLYEACLTLWEDVCGRKMYITGGVGSEYDIEGIGPAYRLPNRDAYAETCAAAGLVFWNHRLLNMTGDSRYADVIERVLYNLLPASVSLDGKEFFYENPLESDGTFARSGTFICACCPPNIAKLYASLGGYFYSSCPDGLYVHQYAASRADATVMGVNITVMQQTGYPWDGGIALLLNPEKPVEFTLRLRLPGWCRNATLAVNGTPADITAALDKGYVAVRRLWSSGDTVTLELDMPVDKVWAHPAVREDNGLLALQRGPVVYCLEEADNLKDLHRVVLPVSAELSCEPRPDLPGAVWAVTGEARLESLDGWEGNLYQPCQPKTEPCRITAVPYAVWNNRGKGTMRVWLRSV